MNPCCYNRSMRSRVLWFILGATLAGLGSWIIYHLPPIRDQLEWRLDAASGIIRGWLYPGEMLPTPISATISEFEPLSTSFPTVTTEMSMSSPTAAPTPKPLPLAVSLPAPRWEKQDWNNCGPATLAFGLRFYGWGGDQFDISDLLKPDRGDRNVNIDELVYYVRTQAGWLGADYRVGGTLEVLKRFIAEGYPVIIEKGYVIESEGPDAGWAGHYLLLTGYDDTGEFFVAQDSFKGPNEVVSYTTLYEGWRAFNYVYMYIYPSGESTKIETFLGDDADMDANRSRTLQRMQEMVEKDPEDAFSWFNLGTNLLYFENYGLAAQAYDNALVLGLPWRFTRYQFGPYIAYYNQGRFQDIIDLADATLKRTNKAEESMLWRGWARYRLGDAMGAVEDFLAALKINHNYFDAQYALEYVGVGY